MPPLSDSFALQVRYVFPADAAPLADGVVTIAGDRIAAVGNNLSGAPAIDLGNVAILPGLVNAHTHLEFSELAVPLGEPGMVFPDWIRQIIRWRQSTGQPQPAAIRRGLDECTRAGVTLLGEIKTEHALDPNELPLLELFEFTEIIALAHERFAPMLERARQALAGPSRRRVTAGLSPHAPYTVHPELFKSLIRLADQHRAPLAFHLAESREELEFVRRGTGPFAELLLELGVWQPRQPAFGARPLDYLRLLASAPRSLVIHGNYLEPDEIELLAGARDRMTLVYCPRTHAYFRHANYPLAKMLAAGVRVALGTDSRASSPDLSLLAEMRHVACHHMDVSSQTVLELGTIRGVEALGRADNSGSITPGKFADLAIVGLPDGSAADPYELLFDSAEPVLGTLFHGRPTWHAPSLPIE